MPRHPWYREFDDWWYCQFGRKQKKLVKGRKNKSEAHKLFLRLTAEDIKFPAHLEHLTVFQVCKAFMRFSQIHHEPDTRDWYRRFLRQFCRVFGRAKATEVNATKVDEWLAAEKKIPLGRPVEGKPRRYRRLHWSSSTRNTVVGCLRRVFNWAVGEGLVLKNPLAKLRKPPMERRDCIPTPAQRRAILTCVRDRGFKLYLYALSQTGARPGEVARVTADNLDLPRGVWVFKKHKTANRTGRPRAVFLTPKMKMICEKLRRKYPDGPLFRNDRGQPFSRNAIRCRFRRIRKKLGLPAGIVAYSLRHAFCTDGLARGVPAPTMSKLLGHEGDRMMRHYDHFTENTENLRNAVITVTQPDPARTSPLGKTG